MPELKLSIHEAHVHSLSGKPVVGLCVHLAVTPPQTHVYSLSLDYEVQIDAVRRPYIPDEQRRLVSVFGPVGIWYYTLHSLPWTSGTVQVPAFIGETSIELSLPCNGEVNSAVKKYVQALSAGDVLLAASFSGAAFYASDDLPLQECPLPDNSRATFRLPLALWNEAREGHSPSVEAFQLA
jgi:hypothetical protein